MPTYSTPVPPERAVGDSGRLGDYAALRANILELRNAGLLDIAAVNVEVNRAIDALPAVATTGLYSDLIGAPTVSQGGGTTALAAPSNVSYYATTERKVGVDANSYPNASSYRVYRDGQSGPLADLPTPRWLSTTTFTTGTYTFYICAVVDGRETQRAAAGPLTVDGQARSSTNGTATGTLTPTGPSAPPASIPGVRSAYEKALYLDDPRLLLYTSFDGGVADAANQARAVTQNGGLIAKVAGPDGQAAWKLNGTTQYLDVPDADDLSISTTGRLSYEIVLRADTLDNFPASETSSEGAICYPLTKGAQNGDYEYQLRFYQTTSQRPNRLSAYAFNPAGGLGAGSYVQETMTPNEWVHIVAVFNTVDKGPDGWGTVSIYKNGVLKDTDSLGDPYYITPANTAGRLFVGSRPGKSFFPGSISKLALFDRALTSAQVKRHYDALGAAATPTTTLAAPTGLVVAAAADRRVTVTCDPYPNAASYRFYEDGTVGVLSTTNTPTRTSGVLNGGYYHYTVSAVVGGVESARADVGDILVDGTARTTANGTGSDVGPFDSNFTQSGPLSSTKFAVEATAGSSATAVSGYAQLKVGGLGAYNDDLEIESRIARANDRFISLDVTPQNGGEAFFGIILRASATTGSIGASPRYHVELNIDGYVSLFKVQVEGTRVVLVNGVLVPGFKVGTPVHAYASIVGNTVRGYFWTVGARPATPTVTAADNSVTGSGRCGIALYGGASSATKQWDIGLFRVGVPT